MVSQPSGPRVARRPTIAEESDSMGILPNVARVMPDVAKDARAQVAGCLDWVGMGRIEVPVTLPRADGTASTAPARVTAYVDLQRPEVRGIHMSRLYLHVDRALGERPLTPASLRALLQEFLASHRDLSRRAMVRIAFDHMLRRPALVSDNTGWKSYPVAVTATMEDGALALEVAIEAAYSSTCPCSAALARQLIQEKFLGDFPADDALDYQRVLAWLGSEEGIMATPHSQRSSAEVRVRLDAARADFGIVELIDAVEGALKTPVQAAVKREDEQAFARLNGANLMFCEDAARRVQAALNAQAQVLDFWARVSHHESLHPHDAVAVATKGLTGGYAPGAEFGSIRG
jgi:GTP cyclohydrolase I